MGEARDAMDRFTNAFFSSEWDTAASSRTSLTQRLPKGSRCHFWRRTYKNPRIARNDKRVAKKGKHE
jgi:hypothetical protein